jgi:xylulokinase
MRREPFSSTSSRTPGLSRSSRLSGFRHRLLAPLEASDAVAGPLDDSIAHELGLPGGIPVAFGSADTAAALVGTGLFEIGPVQLTVGSAAQVVTLRKRPDPDPDLRYHVFASALPGLWYAMAAVQAAGVALSWALKAFNATWEEAYELLDAAPSHGANAASLHPAPGWGSVALDGHLSAGGVLWS